MTALVEAAGIEPALMLTNSDTYGRNRCLKSASWTFAPRKRRAAYQDMPDPWDLLPAPVIDDSILAALLQKTGLDGVKD